MVISLAEAGPTEGGKAAALGALLRAGFPVPPGVVVPASVYRVVAHDLDLPSVLADSGPEEVRRLLATWPLPPDLVAELEDLGHPAVAVRSSASTEDTAEHSAAGQHDSFLGVGRTEIADRVAATWASLWSSRAVAYRQEPAEMAVIVQRHVDADVAGVLFTGPVMTVEASWGLGESVVSGVVTPDAFTVSATGVVDRRPGDKQTRVDRHDTTPQTTQVTPEDRHRLCLTDDQLQRLWHLGQEVSRLLGGSQDIEFAFEGDDLWLLQARPITAPLPVAQGIHGIPGSPGRAAGPARLVHGPGDFARVRRGDVLVCRFTDPAWTPLFAIVAAVVTETGGRLSHAAIVAREHRIPAVLDVPGVLTTLTDNQPVAVDGTTGTVRQD